MKLQKHTSSVLYEMQQQVSNITEKNNVKPLTKHVAREGAPCKGQTLTFLD